MNVNALLVDTLDSLLPTADGVYKGAATEYIVFNYTELPADFADDDAEHYRYHVRHERDDLYRVPLQFRRMAHHERVYLGERVYRVVRYQARQEHGLISTHDGRRARTARLPLW